MFIPDPGSEFFHSGSRIQGQNDSGSASKNLSIFNPKNCYKALGIMILDVHPGSGSRIPGPDLHFLPIPDSGSRGQNGTGLGSATLLFRI
jgi:hypothetical protein